MSLVDSIDHFIIFAGDASYTALVTALKNKGKRVTVVSSLLAVPQPISDELRRSTEVFVDLHDLTAQITTKSDREALV